MSTEKYRVVLEKDTLVFSAAHFITFNGDICESIHGHNYRVKCEIVGPLDENGYVVDFIALRDSLQAIVTELDHHVLLPTEHPLIKVKLFESRQDCGPDTKTENTPEVLTTFKNKRWIFPAEDCVLLPLANTTAELLAKYIGERLMDACREKFGSEISTLIVAVDENRGQWGVVEMDWLT
jgi:6-pyruvoyltetrahydropterin/6-carboxytetrahydropterin synthase